MQVLLTGSSGKLGRAIIKSGKFPDLLTPSSSVLDICDVEKTALFFSMNKIDLVIHAAGLARIVQSEQEPAEAIQKNIVGTSNLVTRILKQRDKNEIRFIYISSDGVYEGTKGDYNESDAAIPATKYGWSKLGAECAVNMLSNYCIIRTRFFDPENIPFEESAEDVFTSKIRVDELVEYIHGISMSDYVGTINIGAEKKSDYECHKKFKPGIRPCSRLDIAKDVPFTVPTDISMNLSRFRRFLDSN